jgi:UDP-glucose 4-epimerase
MAVLITGGAGYIGSHTCAELMEAGRDIIVADRPEHAPMIDRVRAAFGRNVTFHPLEPLDRQGLERIFEHHDIEAVIHFAGVRPMMDQQRAHLPIAWTVILCDVMRRYGVRRLVFSSSAAVYGRPKRTPVAETAPLVAANRYGRTMLMIEEILRDLYETDRKWSIALLRNFNPAGAHSGGWIGPEAFREGRGGQHGWQGGRTDGGREGERVGGGSGAMPGAGPIGGDAIALRGLSPTGDDAAVAREPAPTGGGENIARERAPIGNDAATAREPTPTGGGENIARERAPIGGDAAAAREPAPTGGGENIARERAPIGGDAAAAREPAPIGGDAAVVRERASTGGDADIALEPAPIGGDPDGTPPHLFPRLLRMAAVRKGKLPIYGGDYPTPDGTCIRDYVHVTDLARGHRKALDKVMAETGIDAFNLGSGAGHSVLEVIAAFEKASGVEIPRRIVERRPGDAPVICADPSKALRELGWRAELGLDRMCEDAWKWLRGRMAGLEPGARVFADAGGKAG